MKSLDRDHQTADPLNVKGLTREELEAHMLAWMDNYEEGVLKHCKETVKSDRDYDCFCAGSLVGAILVVVLANIMMWFGAGGF